MRVIKFRVWDCELKEMIYDAQDESGYESDGFTDFLHQESRYKVMQFTGLLDKSGKEIWEGDIVEHFKENFEVRWSSIHAHFFGHRLDSHGTSFFRIGSDLKDAEVLGNIYENGDLLK